MCEITPSGLCWDHSPSVGTTPPSGMLSHSPFWLVLGPLPPPLLCSSGVFTDTHMLSLMYAGDLCQWHMLCSAESTQSGNCGGGERDNDTALLGVKPCNLEEEPDDSESTAVHCSKDALSQRVNPCNFQQASPVAMPPCSLHPYTLMDTACGVEHSQKWTTTFDAPALCDRYLARYIGVARGPLKSVGWSYERAVKLLVELRRSRQVKGGKSGSSAF